MFQKRVWIFDEPEHFFAKFYSFGGNRPSSLFNVSKKIMVKFRMCELRHRHKKIHGKKHPPFPVVNKKEFQLLKTNEK